MITDAMKRVPTRLASDLRLLTAASRLKQFTLTELAEHAGVGREATRSFLRRDENFEPFKVDASEARGRPRNIWRLRPDRALGVAARVAEVSRVIGWAPAPVSDLEPKTWQLLRSSLDRLDQLALSDPDRPAILHRAEMYLGSAEMELRDRMALSPQSVGADEQRVVVQAGGMVKLFGAIIAAPHSVRELLNPSRELRKRCMSGLGDWSEPLDVPAIPADMTLDPVDAGRASDLLDMALYAAKREEALDSVLVPVLAMLSCKPAWTAGTHASFAQDIEHRISRSGVADDRFLATALAATAAAFDVDAAVDPLFHVLSNRRLITDWRPEWRTICNSSLARFARPGRNSQAATLAAAACNYLLVQTADNSTDLPVLATAALGAPRADTGSLLHDIGRVVQAHGTAGRHADGPMARNLGLALGRDDFAPLQMHIDNLLVDDNYGPLLIDKVSDEKHRALRLTDTKQHPVVVGAWPALARSLGRQEGAGTLQPIEVKENLIKRLWEILSHQLREKRTGLLTARLAQRASAVQANAA